jgi:hypothetical protein
MVKKLEGKKSQRKLDILKSYQDVFDSPQGKEVLHDMMKTNGMFSTTFNENPYTMAYLEGRRSFVADLLVLLGRDVTQIHKAMKEQEDIERLYQS